MLFLCEWTMGVWCNACSGLRLDRNTMTRFDVWLQKVVEGLGVISKIKSAVRETRMIMELNEGKEMGWRNGLV